MRILSILGTRPEAIKMAPVIKEIERDPKLESLLCVTAQHRQLLDQVLSLFDISPDVDLDLMQHDQSLISVTSDIFTHLDPVIKKFTPDWVLVQGDTTTVFIASILAFYNRIKLGHVEAGLRTSNKFQPFPEEINRRLTSVVTDLHFTPTAWAKQNLINEGIPREQILITGNPVVDAVQIVADIPFLIEDLVSLIKKDQTSEKLLNFLSAGGSDKTKLILVTAHRRENFGKPLQNICGAIRYLAEKYGDTILFLYPVHPNPNIQGPVLDMLGGLSNVVLSAPLNYLPFVHILKKSNIVLTDSGGLQEEAPGFGKPVLVMRQVTERPEGIEAGTVRLVGTNKERIIQETSRLLDNPVAYREMAHSINPYGDGKAASRIVKGLVTYQNNSELNR